MANLFIALGGTGYKSVSKLQEYCENYASAKGGNDSNYYLYVDTDETSINPVIKKQNTFVIDLSKFKVVDYYKTVEQKKQINIWFDGENISIPQVDLKAGAKGIRQLTRMGFYLHPGAKDVITRLLDGFIIDNQLAIKNNDNNLNSLKIYVVSGTAGGTGSGILYDFLYTMWRYYIDDKGMNGNLDVCGVLLMPNLFLKVNDKDLVNKYKLNGYAFIQETNALVKIGQQTHLPDQFFNYFNGEVSSKSPSTAWQPFQKAILIDDLNINFQFTQRYLYETISEFLFSFTLGRDVYGDDNIVDGNNAKIQELLDSALTNTAPDLNREYINYFGSYGILVIKSANEYFARYTKARLKEDTLDSVIGTLDDFSEDLYQEIQVYIEKLYNDFERKAIIIPPKGSSKEEKLELANVLKLLDFNKKFPEAKEPKIKEFLSQLSENKKSLDALCDDVKKYLYTLHESKLSEHSLYSLINAVKKADNHFYNIWDTNNKLNFDEKSFDVVNTVESKMMKYFCYHLSKGSENNNNNGYLDLFKEYLEKLVKELVLLRTKLKDEQSEIITDLQERKKNQSSAIVPSVDDIIGIVGKNLVFKEDGEFVKWYQEAQFDIKNQHQKINAKIYTDTNPNKKFINFDIKFKNEKYRGNFVEELERVTLDALDSQSYQSIINKTVYDLIDEGSYSIDYFDRFEYPFIRLNTPINASRFVFAGSFNNRDTLLSNLGYHEANINHIKIDDLFFKDRIIKIAFHNSIALDDYFLFNQLKTNFNENYTKLKKDNKIVATPFIHKEFGGEKFDGNVFKLLSEGGNKLINNDFANNPENTKQLIYKFGLLFIYDYVQKAISSCITSSGFDKEFIRFDETNKQISLFNISYSTFTKRYSIDKSKTIEIEVECVSNPLNYQGNKKVISSAIAYFKSQLTRSLDDVNTIEVATLAWDKLNIESHSEIMSESYVEEFQNILTNFFEFGDNPKVNNNFTDYFEAIFS
ncbi:MAG: tubulin-like doman-containing protein [Bacteroidales bacterium]|nr:tubulin-like doman-containing protein [Bacteroidales bacterium]